MKRLTLLLICALCAAPSNVLAADRKIDAAHSTLTVSVYKSGLFSFAADNHTINAPLASGELSDPLTSVSLTVDAAHMTVLDRETSTDKPAQVQARMLGPDVLDVAQYPTITFRSTSISAVSSGGWDVSGDLTIHGTTRPITLRVTETDGHYRGSTTLKQTDFGIHPINIAGGTVKVKDGIGVTFDIVASP